jgi:hypothetical protein
MEHCFTATAIQKGNGKTAYYENINYLPGRFPLCQTDHPQEWWQLKQGEDSFRFLPVAVTSNSVERNPQFVSITMIHIKGNVRQV